MARQNDAQSDLPDHEESPTALNVENIFRKIGFTCLIIIIIAALCGFFSSGQFSSAVLKNADGSVSVEYEKYGRLMKDVDITLSLPAGDAETYSVRLGRDFTRAYQIETITPAPDKMLSDNSALILRYTDLAKGDNVTVWLTVKPTTPGHFTSSVSVNALPEVTFSQWVYP